MSEVQTPTPAQSGANGTVLSRWLVRPEAPALVFLAVLLVAFSLSSDEFLSGSNLESILVSVAVLGTIALAVNQVILCGEIDISTGSMMGLCAVAAGAVATSTGGLILPLLTGVAVGALAGAANGLLVTLGRIPSIIVTLGMLYALRGVILLVTGGTWITGIPDGTRVLGTGSVLGIEYPVFVLLILFVVMEMVSRHSTWGRNVFAVGGNRRASRLAGLPIDRVRFLSFVLVGVFVGIASIIYLGRAGSVQTNTGTGLELQVVAAVVIGGTSISGGRGSTLAALTGAVLIGVILNGLILVGVPGIWQDAVLGALILLAVTTDVLRRRLLGDKS
ncbi:MAG: Predicted L-rhamnose ABC transporter, transmembrane component 2 [uncultured Rubrobacteraceae bacterium]|uniref:Autoinducer 2 import system permease protein LsrC n=1 Tax=uncultured Rubrobacteraceae bacterium TaxID=349277 RepID=A0A6J4R4A2_9ACTN|nr:MAG: Predicted L-rhamnose ABC transporter, transmembrane component 2 [uncultured Rubrobacteraceae bacterium]